MHRLPVGLQKEAEVPTQCSRSPTSAEETRTQSQLDLSCILFVAFALVEHWPSVLSNMLKYRASLPSCWDNRMDRIDSCSRTWRTHHRCSVSCRELSDTEDHFDKLIYNQTTVDVHLALLGDLFLLVFDSVCTMAVCP